jgi:hypothetical protein
MTSMNQSQNQVVTRLDSFLMLKKIWSVYF